MCKSYILLFEGRNSFKLYIIFSSYLTGNALLFRYEGQRINAFYGSVFPENYIKHLYIL
jgi:hypothetical protein